MTVIRLRVFFTLTRLDDLESSNNFFPQVLFKTWNLQESYFIGIQCYQYSFTLPDGKNQFLPKVRNLQLSHFVTLFF